MGEDSVRATRPHPSEQQDRHAECASCQRKCEKSGLGNYSEAGCLSRARPVLRRGEAEQSASSTHLQAHLSFSTELKK
jgi:hypothetical protein